MQFVETHCHIQSSDKTLATDAGEAVTRALWAKAGHPSGDELIERAAERSVTQLICVGCSLPDSQLAVDFVQNRPGCWASIGIHPHEAKDYTAKTAQNNTKLQQFADLVERPKVVAVGECGLDYFYEHSSREQQAAVLKFQIELALKHNKPLIFHVREAFDDFWQIFESYQGWGGSSQPIRGVLHSFTDSQSNLDRAVAAGLYIGVNGIVTFTKSQEQLDMYKNIPLSSILLETDSPFLTPSPYRGNICEPYHTSVTAKFLAKLRHESLNELASATTVNARKLFGIDSYEQAHIQSRPSDGSPSKTEG